MSTRCQIGFEGYSVLIYKHRDGYPEGVLPWLEPFVKAFIAERGWDDEYLVARVLMRLGVIENGEDGAVDSLGNIRTVGYGVGTKIHHDLSYLYLVKDDGTVETRERNYDKPGHGFDATGLGTANRAQPR